MNAPKHTPGPWVTQQLKTRFETLIWRAEHHSVLLATVHGLNHEANARLIAAAPKLLAELRAAVSRMESMMRFYRPHPADKIEQVIATHPDLMRAKQAIAEVEGAK